MAYTVWLKRIRSIPTHIQLLKRDPERFGRNLLQFTNPSLFEQRLLDLVPTPPMHVTVEPGDTPRLNLLDTAWTKLGMTGGPNTAINLAARVALAGIKTRVVSTSALTEIDPSWLKAHISALIGQDAPDIEITSAADEHRPLALGSGDIFMATHWVTALQLKAVLPLLPIKRFFFLLQEFEPGFYPWSSNYAMASEALSLDFWPIINERFLADYLFRTEIGGLSRPDIRTRSIIFEPAVDTTLFHARRDRASRPHRLLFYARPTNTRNMFGIGLSALREATRHDEFNGWEFLSIGSRDGIPDLKLGGGHMLRRAPWVGYEGYSDLLRTADVLLCPMISPHTSYPVLEMVATGGISVTNVFANKTEVAFQSLSTDIVAVEPTVSGFVGGLRRAAAQVSATRLGDGLRGVHGNWSEALDPCARLIADLCRRSARDPRHIDV